MLNVYFYVAYPYYFPHFLPISRLFNKKGHKVVYILSNIQNSENIKYIAEKNNLIYKFGDEHLFLDNFDVVFFANSYVKAKNIKAHTIFLEHGIGTKSKSFYQCIEYFDTYIVEGKQKYETLKNLYPDYEYKLEKVGFSKFDDIVNFSTQDKINFFNKYNLDITKKTILYAPTFFPSSIEKMDNNFPKEFENCNVIIKPHYLTYERKKYNNQVKKLNIWKKYENCLVLALDEYNIVPFLTISDIMISDESSAMFEFAALNKPVISNRYFKLRWSYYIMPWKLNQRIDKGKDFYRNILDNAYNYKETLKYTHDAIKNPNKLENKRLDYSKDLCGEIDGKVSYRIYDRIMSINEGV